MGASCGFGLTMCRLTLEMGDRVLCSIVSETLDTPYAVVQPVIEVNFWSATAVSREAVRFLRDENRL